MGFNETVRNINVQKEFEGEDGFGDSGRFRKTRIVSESVLGQQKELKEKGQELYKKALMIINEKGIWGNPDFGKGFIKNSLFHKATPFLGPIDEGTTDALVLGFIAKAENCKQFKDFAEFTDTILIFVKKPMAQEMRIVTELQEGGKVFYCSPTGKHKIPKRWPRADESQLFDLEEKIDKLFAFLNKENEK